MARRKSETWGKQDMKWFIIFMIILVWTVSRAVLIDMVMAEGPIEPRLTAEEIRILINLHNKVRSNVGVGPLVWSKSLAGYAQSWADHLASTSCRLEHRPYSGKRKQRYGENLFMGTAGYHGVADAVRAWEREKSVYHGEPLSSSNWYPSGHYTQLVWKNTSQIGCAKAECRGNVIVVCNYDSPGNVMGQKPY